MNNILIANFLNYKAIKIGKFLKNKGYHVFGIDKFENEDSKLADRFFKVDLRHRESLELVFTVVKPDVIIFCMDNIRNNGFDYVDYSYPTYMNILSTAIRFGIKKVILSLE